MRRSLLRLYDRHMSGDGKKVDYAALRADPDWRRFVDATAELQKVPPASSMLHAASNMRVFLLLSAMFLPSSFIFLGSRSMQHVHLCHSSIGIAACSMFDLVPSVGRNHGARHVRL